MELSTRQREVADLVAEGKTEAEVGAALNISPHTVKVHKRLAYRKLGVRNAVELSLKLRGKT